MRTTVQRQRRRRVVVGREIPSPDRDVTTTLGNRATGRRDRNDSGRDRTDRTPRPSRGFARTDGSSAIAGRTVTRTDGNATGGTTAASRKQPSPKTFDHRVLFDPLYWNKMVHDALYGEQETEHTAVTMIVQRRRTVSASIFYRFRDTIVNF